MEPNMSQRGNIATSLWNENVAEDEDMLSFLPNHIAHIILSFLSTKDIAKLCLTSKKCEDFCLSVPSLMVDDIGISYPKTTQFLDFLVNFMSRRQNVGLKRLCILWSSKTNNEVSKIVCLLSRAIRCHVEDLNIDLDLEVGEVFVMPLDVFFCESLRSLTINLLYGELKFPSSPHGFAHLRSLDLSYLEMNDDSFGDIISSVCKFLEKLSLDSLLGIKIFKIYIPSLLELSIARCSFEHLDISAPLLQTLHLDSPPSMNVYAPNLLCLHWWGAISEYCFVENLSLLQTVHLSLWQSEPGRIKLHNLLSNIVQISCLHISSRTIMALYDDGFLPFIFDNLQTLVLNLETSPWSDSLVQATVSLFQGLPCNLKTLRIRTSSSHNPLHSEQHTYTYQAKFWESLNLRFVQGLEEIDINLRGGKNEESFLEYLLENAVKLRKMTILFGDVMPSTIVCKLMAVVARGAVFSRRGQYMMVLELKKALT